MNASFRIGLLVPTANYFFWRILSSSNISTKLFERRKVCGLGLSRCCAAPASLLLRNRLTSCLDFGEPNGFGGGLIDGMTFLATEVIAVRDARASYQLEHRAYLIAMVQLKVNRSHPTTLRQPTPFFWPGEWDARISSDPEDPALLMGTHRLSAGLGLTA